MVPSSSAALQAANSCSNSARHLSPLSSQTVLESSLGLNRNLFSFKSPRQNHESCVGRQTRPRLRTSAMQQDIGRSKLWLPQGSMAAERSSGLDPAMMLLRQRIIFLGSQVDDLSADAVISQLLLLDAQDPEQDIKLFINSPGGSVTAGMGIYDAMKLCRAPVSTICFGLAASMGAFLLCAGSKGKRFCMPNARVMIHQPLGGAGGTAIDGALQVREMMYHKIKLNKIMAMHTGQTYEQIEMDTDRDYFLTPWQAVEYGICDAVIDGDKEGLVAPIGEVTEPPKSKIWDAWTIKEGRERKKLPGEMSSLPSLK